MAEKIYKLIQQCQNEKAAGEERPNEIEQTQIVSKF